MKNPFLLFSFFVISQFSKEQTISSNLTENFAFSVKTIDDFIDRFDYTRQTEFENYFCLNYPDEQLNRKKLLLSLFNYKNKFFPGKQEVVSFINTVTDTSHPIFISFSDSGWYAELNCKVIFAEKEQPLTLILKVDESRNNSVKWSIVSANARFLIKNKTTNDSLLQDKIEIKNESKSDEGKYFLHPVSHALDFMNIDQLFSIHKNTFERYIYNGPQTAQLNDLIDKVKHSQIKFLQVDTVTYHFLQIKGWIAVVSYFNRYEKNSGWLIDTLIKATNEQKRNYLKNKLNIII